MSAMVYNNTSRLFGNGCRHDMLKPRFYAPPEKHGLRTDVIVWSVESLKRFYYNPDTKLKDLKMSRESLRQQRSEARERDASVLQVLMHYCELATLRVGVPLDDGEFHSLSMKAIAQRLGWRTREDDKSPRTRYKGIKRVWRALKSLRKAGYIDIHKRVEKIMDEMGNLDFKGLPAIKNLNPKVFYDLGITPQRLRIRRDQASKRLKKKFKAFQRKVEDTLKMPRQYQQKVLDIFQGRRAKARKKENIERKEHSNKVRYQAAKLSELIAMPENEGLTYSQLKAKYPGSFKRQG